MIQFKNGLFEPKTLINNILFILVRNPEFVHKHLFYQEIITLCMHKLRCFPPGTTAWHPDPVLTRLAINRDQPPINTDQQRPSIPGIHCFKSKYHLFFKYQMSRVHFITWKFKTTLNNVPVMKKKSQLRKAVIGTVFFNVLKP
jgi:hypothetical protein